MGVKDEYFREQDHMKNGPSTIMIMNQDAMNQENPIFQLASLISREVCEQAKTSRVRLNLYSLVRK